jgi:hypothetical protein
LVHDFRRFLELGVALGDLAGDRRIDIGHGFRGFDLAERLSGGDLGSRPWKIDVNDVAERVLREMGDAHADGIAFAPSPLVFLRVLEIFRVHAHLRGNPCPPGRVA